MQHMDSSRSTDPANSIPRLTVPSTAFVSCDTIEDYLDRLNRISPIAQRTITQWGAKDKPRLQLGAVQAAAADATPDTMFLAEAWTSFGLDVRAQRTAVAGASYSVGLVLAGSMQVTLASGEFTAQAGEGIIIDPSHVERTHFAVNSHFVEFTLPRTNLLRLGAELVPGGLAGQPQFAPLLPGAIARRLLAMAMQTAEMLGADRSGPGTRVMFERWIELIALTLLHDHQPRSTARAAQPAGAAPPRSVRRALDYIDAHVQSDILLADIATAACVSASTLLRQFNDHLGLSPGAFLRQVRLDRARSELRQDTAGSIREVAQRYGFQSAGKFSQAYLRRFGERPRDGRSAR
jgi:AraC-like DNA-binding protein